MLGAAKYCRCASWATRATTPKSALGMNDPSDSGRSLTAARLRRFTGEGSPKSLTVRFFAALLCLTRLADSADRN